MRSSAAFVVWALAMVPGLSAQDPSEDDARAAAKVVADLDAAAYRAVDHGLAALSFEFAPVVRLADVPKFRVVYWWRAEGGEAVGFRTDDGVVHALAPGALGPETRFFVDSAKDFGRQFRGEPLAQRFAHCRARVRVRRVNLTEETDLILEPRQPENLKRLVISIDRHGRPWKWERTMVNGYQMVENHRYDPRDEGVVLVSRSVIQPPRRAGESGHSYANEFGYQRTRGYLLPARISEVSKDGGAGARSEVLFVEVKVDDDVAAKPPL